MKSEELIIMGAAAVPFLVEFLKQIWPKINPRYFSIIICFGLGLIYAISKGFMPIDFFTRLAGVSSVTFAAATALYKLQK